jgi:hypothetical protein
LAVTIPARIAVRLRIDSQTITKKDTKAGRMHNKKFFKQSKNAVKREQLLTALLELEDIDIKSLEQQNTP